MDSFFREIKYTQELLSRYRKALDTAVKISTRHNVKPIRGKTYIYCDVGPKMDTFGWTGSSYWEKVCKFCLLVKVCPILTTDKSWLSQIASMFGGCGYGCNCCYGDYKFHCLFTWRSSHSHWFWHGLYSALSGLGNTCSLCLYRNFDNAFYGNKNALAMRYSNA